MAHSTARAVKAARDYVGLTQAELAGRLSTITGESWSDDMVTSMETGRKKFDDELLLALERALGFRVEWFLKGPPKDLLLDSVMGPSRNRQLPLFNEELVLDAVA